MSNSHFKGPFILCFRVFEGFLHYFDGSKMLPFEMSIPFLGVYSVIEDLETLHVYDHCVKTIGWGVEQDGREYLVGVNSWGVWAKNGNCLIIFNAISILGTFKISVEMLRNSRGDM